MSDEKEANNWNVYKRLSAIQGDVTAVEKNASVEGKYKAVTHDDVTRMLRPLFVKHGIVAIPSLIESTDLATGEQWGKRQLWRRTARYSIQFVNIDRPTDHVTIVIDAQADDNGDKNPGKALSYAVKYALLKVCMVPTGEDDEERVPEDEVKPQTITEAQQSDLLDKCEKWYGKDGVKRLDRYLVNAYGKGTTIGAIPAKDFDRILTVLESNKPKPEDPDADTQGKTADA